MELVARKKIIPLNWFGDEDTQAEKPQTIEPPKGVIEVPEIEIPKDISKLEPDKLKLLFSSLVENLGKTKELAQVRLHEIMEKKEKYKAKSAEQQAQLEEIERKKLESIGEFKMLYEKELAKTKILTDDVSKTTAHFEKEFESLRKEIPDEYLSLIPESDIRSKIEWVKKFKETVISKTKQPEVKITPPVGDSGRPPVSKQVVNTREQEIRASIAACNSPEELVAFINAQK